MKEFGAWLVRSVTTLGPWGLFLVAFGDSAFVPLPQGVDALLIAQTIAAPETAWYAATLAVLGSVLGSLILYWMARRGGKALLARRMTAQGIAKLEAQTERWGALVLIPPMMIPLPLPTKLVVLAAGAFQMSVPRFVLATAFGRTVRYFGEAYIAVLYGDHTTDFIKENVWFAVGIGIALVLLFYIVNRVSTQKTVTGT